MQLMNILYLWAKDNNEFGYRQGMNEVLAIIVFTFFAEQIKCQGGQQVYTQEEAQLLSDDQVMDIMFDSSQIYADIFWCFERVMGLGIKQLY